MSVLKRWLPALAWSAVILIASGEQFSAASSGGWFHDLFGVELPYVVHVLFRKSVHVIAYGILGALAIRAAEKKWIALAYALLIAVIDETHQSTLASRTGSPWDVLLDMIGAAIAVHLVQNGRPLSSPEGEIDE